MLEIDPGRELIVSVHRRSQEGTQASQASIVLTSRKDRHASNRGASIVETETAVSESLVLVRDRDNNALSQVAIAIDGDVEGCRWKISNVKGKTNSEEQRVILRIPSDKRPRQLEIITSYRDASSGTSEPADQVLKVSSSRSSSGLRSLIKGGPARWSQTLDTTGTLGLQSGAYAVDTLTIPEETPWKTWFRTSALDFFDDGRMAIATYGGDVWLVSGIDESLVKLKWKRFAAGLYEPMGVKVVDGQVYVTCKDRMVRLRDLDGNQEADFYENFFADPDVAFHFHSFNFDLQRDSQGNLYYAKGGHGSDYSIPGAVIQISPDGQRHSILATGFRAPNGMGILPDNRLTGSDNQGQWMPASKINLLKKGGFYGWVPTYDGKGKWGPDGGRIDIATVKPPQSFEEPMVWMPQEFDNSSGGQLWVDDARWGPLSGRLLHTSFGKGWMSYVMMQQVDDVTQAAIIRLPFDFRTGIQRARVNPRDGQVYACGLQGWNGGGRIGLLDNGVQRVRYTGQPIQMIRDCRVESDGLRIDFNFPVEATAASDLTSYTARHWNYRWRAEYGSDMYAPSTGEVGPELLKVTSALVDKDGRSVKLIVGNLRPVDQVHLVMKIRAEDGTPFEEELYWTIHRIPKASPATPYGYDYHRLRDGLQNAARKFSQQRTGRVAFLGGSITAGKGWRDLVCEDLQRRFPETKFEFINAGISSLGSTPGAFRFERDVLAEGPIDLLFEEAAVNDDTNGFNDVEQIRGMEGIVRHARIANPAMDIVLLHFVDPGKIESYNRSIIPSVIVNHEQVAERYRLPSIDLAKEVTERIRAGEFEWDKDFKNLHPSPFGHQLYARSISDCLTPRGPMTNLSAVQ